jgi:hypothetical protein
MTISKDRVKPSPLPDSWKLAEIFTTGIVLGGYLAVMTVIFFWAAYKTNFFPVRIIKNARKYSLFFLYYTFMLHILIRKWFIKLVLQH